MKLIEAFAVQCSDCFRYLGVSDIKQKQEVLCTNCAKKKYNTNIHQEKNDKSVEPKGSPIVKDEASTANTSGDGGSLGDTAGCSGVGSTTTKEVHSKNLPADLNSYRCGHKQELERLKSSQSTKDKNSQQCLNGEKPIEGRGHNDQLQPTRTTETPDKGSVDNTSTTPVDIILLAPNGKFTEKDMKLSDKSKRELEDIRKKLNLPEVAKTLRLL